MKLFAKFHTKNRLLMGVGVLVVGILVAIYFETWIAVGILGVLLVQLLVVVYLLNSSSKTKSEDGEISDQSSLTEVFGDTLVKEVMVPRTDMTTILASFNVEDSLDIVLFNGFSRVPVCGEGIDDISGIVHAKDLMSAARDMKGKTLVSEIKRDAHFVPETKRIADLLREMQAERFHVAIAIDEYGGTAGLVTLEDLIEEIVGEITDEFDIEKPIIERLELGGFRVNGRVLVGELSDTLGVEIPEGNWSTMGGFIVTTLGRIPEEDEEVVASGHRFIVEKVHGRRIARVKITPLPETELLETESSNKEMNGVGKRVLNKRAK